MRSLLKSMLAAVCLISNIGFANNLTIGRYEVSKQYFEADILYWRNVSNELGTVIAYGRFTPKFGAGFNLKAGVFFDEDTNFKTPQLANHKDLTINWRHFSRKSDFTDTIGNLSLNNRFTQQSGLDEVNIELGQRIKMFNPLTLRIHGGLHYGYILDKNHQNLASTTQVFTQNKITTIGPRLGLDTSYELLNHFHLLVGAAIGELYATSKTFESIVVNSGNRLIHIKGDATNHNGIFHTDFHTGIEYVTPSNNGQISAKIGWDSISYHNAAGANHSANIGWNGFVAALRYTV